MDEINFIAKEVGLDIAQVHKNYTEEMIADIDIPVWYAVSVRDENSVNEANEAFQYDNVIGVVTDSHVKGQMGGTGVTFNWDLLEDIEPNVNLILAGGLNPDNIEDAIDKVEPNIVDVSSGVEHTIDGQTKKSKDKVTNLVRKVKGHE